MTQHLEKNYHKNLLHSQRRLIYLALVPNHTVEAYRRLPGSNHIFVVRRPFSVEFRTLPCPIMPRKSSSPAKKAPSKKGLVPLKPVSPFCEGLLKSLGDDPSRVVRYCSSSLGTSSRAKIRFRGLNIHLSVIFQLTLTLPRAARQQPYRCITPFLTQHLWTLFSKNARRELVPLFLPLNKLSSLTTPPCLPTSLRLRRTIVMKTIS